MSKSKLTGMAPFWERCLEVAQRETRVVTTVRREAGLPAGGYAFAEFYCADPACDCRRVRLQVWPEHQPGTVLATINYGWETRCSNTARASRCKLAKPAAGE